MLDLPVNASNPATGANSRVTTHYNGRLRNFCGPADTDRHAGLWRIPGTRMKFKSIQFSVVALAGASVLAVVAALVLYALFAGSRTQALVQERTQALLEQVINERLVTMARGQVAQIQRELEYPLTVARDLANTNALLDETDANGQPLLGIGRAGMSNLLRQTVALNPKLLDAFAGWEPNAFAGNDSQ